LVRTVKVLELDRQINVLSKLNSLREDDGTSDLIFNNSELVNQWLLVNEKFDTIIDMHGKDVEASDWNSHKSVPLHRNHV
jgi:hypothetical protein